MLATAFAVGWATVVNQGTLHGWRAGLVSAILGLGALLAIVGPNLLSHGRSGAGADLSLTQVADQLAVAIGKQWQDEARRQRLNDPHPLPVAWGPASLDLVEPWDSLITTARSWPSEPPTDPSRSVASPAELAGTDNDLADRLIRIPTGRLVVLGDPGAGKTMLMVRLVLDLLAKRAPGGPVPVLVSMAGWDPVDEDLATWLAGRLTLDHDGLNAPVPPEAGAVSRAQALLDQRLLLPILDGLDELPEAVWGRAIGRINDWLPPRQGLVVASRTAAYRQATAPVDPNSGLPVRVWGAAGIVLRTVAPEAVRAYLCRDAGSPAAAARWYPLLATLGTSTPAAQALTNPLLVSLARTIYNPRPGERSGPLPDPAELCDMTRLPTREAIQEQLFDAFIPAAYRPHPDPRRRSRWKVDQASRWLAWIARHLEHNRGGTTDIAWWQLHYAAPRPLFGFVCGLLGGLMGGVAGGVAVGLAGGFVGGLVGGLAGSLRGWLWATPTAQLNVAPFTRTHWSTRGFIVGLMIGLVVGFAFGLLGGLLGGLIGGFLGGLTGGRWIPSRSQPDVVPSRRLRWSTHGLVVGGAIGLAVGSAFGLAVGLAVGSAFALVTGLERSPADLTRAADPRILLAHDRSAYVTLGLVGGLAGGLAVGLPGGPIAGLTCGLIVGLAFGLGESAWGWFAITWCWSALQGRLPWRLMAFLVDAHQQGVLRQAGAVYQFRHADLQHRLASRP